MSNYTIINNKKIFIDIDIKKPCCVCSFFALIKIKNTDITICITCLLDGLERKQLIINDNDNDIYVNYNTKM